MKKLFLVLCLSNLALAQHAEEKKGRLDAAKEFLGRFKKDELDKCVAKLMKTYDEVFDAIEDLPLATHENAEFRAAWSKAQNEIAFLAKEIDGTQPLNKYYTFSDADAHGKGGEDFKGSNFASRKLLSDLITIKRKQIIKAEILKGKDLARAFCSAEHVKIGDFEKLKILDTGANIGFIPVGIPAGKERRELFVTLRLAPEIQAFSDRLIHLANRATNQKVRDTFWNQGQKMKKLLEDPEMQAMIERQPFNQN